MTNIRALPVEKMNTVSFTVPGQPVAKGRPKFSRAGGFVKTYTPANTVNYESLVKVYATQEMAGRAPFEKPIYMRVEAYLTIPASWSKKRRQKALDGEISATKKPDADNVAKSITDACNGLVFRDDAQVVSLRVEMQYSDNPRVDVCVQELDLESA